MRGRVTTACRRCIRAITADTALRRARVFSMEPQFWINLQSRYDLEVATATLRERIEAEVAPLVA